MLRTTVVALLLVAQVALAADFYWAGTNTAFANSANWNGRNPASGPAPTSTDMSTASQAFTSYVAPGVYNVGSTLKLPKNGKLVFSSSTGSTTTIKLTPTTGAESVATFTGGQIYDQFNDFSCHSNWRVGNVDGTIPTYPPCIDDTAIFSNTVNVWSDTPTVNVRKITAVGGDVSSTANLPAFQFDGIDTTRFFINQGTDKCNTLNGGNCFCKSSCPSAASKRQQIAIERAHVKSLAQAHLDQLMAPVTRSFSVSFDRSMVNTNPGDVDTFLAANKQAYMTILKDTFMTRWNIAADKVTITDVIIESSTQRVQVTGSITGAALYFTTPGAALAGATGPTITIVLNSGTAPTTTSTAFFVAAYSIMPAALIQAQVAKFGMDMETQCGGDAACSGIVPAIKDLFNLYSDPQFALDQACPAGVCPVASSIETTLKSTNVAARFSRLALDLKEANRNLRLAAMAGLMAGVDLNAASIASFVSAVTTTNVVVKAIHGAAGNAAAVPTSRTATFNVGGDLPAEDLNILINEDNLALLKDTLTASVNNVGFLSSLSGVNSVTVLASRRRAGAQLQITVQYTAYCPANNAAGCAITSPSPIFNTVTDLTDTLVKTYTITVHPCMNLVAADLWDQTCLVTEFQAETNTKKYNKEQALAAITRLLACNFMGRTQAGACFAPSEDANYQATAAAVANQLTYPSSGGGGSSSASSGGGGAGAAGIGAGVAGGAVVIIAIVVVVVMRKRNGRGGSSKKGEDRTVVAFENPMYDDPAKTGEAVVYDAGENGGHDDGLYDEPAYNTTGGSVANKSNPLYSSAENLATGEQAEEGGYLDVAPEDAPGFGDDE